MTFLAARTDRAQPSAAPRTTAVAEAPTRRRHAITEPTRDWMELADGRWVCHVSAEDRREATLSPVPDQQAVRLLEIDGLFHILTGPVRDDRAMKIAAEDVIAGF